MNGKPIVMLAGALVAAVVSAGVEWAGQDWTLRGEGGVVCQYELSAGQSIDARRIYISTNDCGAALVVNGATVTASGTSYLGCQRHTNLASTVSLALTNATMTIQAPLIVDSIPSGSATLTLGPGSLLSASYFQNYSAIHPNVYFDGGRFRIAGTTYRVFYPSGHSWTGKADGGWSDNWANPSMYVYANEGPIDLSVGTDVQLVRGNAARQLYLRGTKGFVKRGPGVLDWVWYPEGNNGYIGGDATYTGDTVVKEGGIRVGDTYTYCPPNSSDRRTLRNPMPPQSPLILEANTFLDVSSNVSTWCSISGAGIVTNRTSLMRGKVVLGGTVADCELSPAAIGGAVDVYKLGEGTLTVETSRIDGALVASNGTLRIASGSSLAVSRIELHPNTTLDARGATLTNVVFDLNGRTVGFSSVSDVQATVTDAPGGTLVFGADGSDATLSQAAEADVLLVKKGTGVLTVNAGSNAGDLALVGGSVVYPAIRPRGYRHYRFKVDATYKSTAAGMQFSEFRLMADGEDVTGLRAGIQYAPYNFTYVYPPDYDLHTSYGSEIVKAVVDGSLSTKWLDYRARANRIATEGDDLYIQVDYAEERLVTAYSWATANDGGPTADGRDPAAWRLLASDDGEAWETLDARTDMGPYAPRNAWVGDFAVTYPEHRYERTRSFGTVSVSAGTTLDLRGAGFTCRGLVNHGGTVLKDAGTAIMLTAAAGTDFRVKSEESALAGDVVKTGAGTTTLLGTWAVDGAVAVSNGTLRCLVDGFGGKFFRMTITKNNGAAGWTQFAEFYLYDKDGRIIDDGRPYSRAADGSAPATLGERQVCEQEAYTDYGSERINGAFDNRIFVLSGSTAHASKFAAKTSPTAEKPIVFSFRMPANTPRVHGYDFVAANDQNGTRNPVSWTLEGSHDGIAWCVLDERVDAETPRANSTIDTTTGVVTPVFFNHGTPYGTAGADDPEVDDAFPLGSDAIVSVADGATLAFGSSQMRLAALAVDADSTVGRIERFTPAENGTLHVTTSGSVRTLCSQGDLPLFPVGELRLPELLRSWTVAVNGMPAPGLCVRWKDGRIVMARTGSLCILLR